jgi:hypothetical protein
MPLIFKAQVIGTVVQQTTSQNEKVDNVMMYDTGILDKDISTKKQNFTTVNTGTCGKLTASLG